MIKNNKGFSLIELVIVIGIMAILTAALAPQLMRYIEKSRTTTDYRNGQSVKTMINSVLTDEASYSEIMTAIKDDANPDYVEFNFDGSKPTSYNIASLNGGKFDKELNSVITEWPECEASQHSGFYCRIYCSTTTNSVLRVDIENNPFATSTP